MNKQVRVLGVRFDAVTMEQAVERCEDALDRRTAMKIYTPNPEIVLRATKDEAFQGVLRRGDLVIPDGIGIVYATRMKGKPVPERVPGIELLDQLFALSAKRGHSVFLFGSKPGIADRAGREIAAKHPGLRIAGTRNGYFSAEEEPAIVQTIRDAAPDVLVVALGAPKQETFIDRHLEEIGARVAIGVGGALDVYAGEVKRAPAVFQKLGLEWLYRGIKQPSRLPRLLKLPLFLVRVLFTRGSVRQV